MPYSKSFNKKTGVTYVYEILENKWDPEKGYPVSKRKLIGKIDPETGDIVPTRKRGSKDKKYNVPADLNSTATPAGTSENERIRALLTDELTWLQKSAADINERIKQIQDTLNAMS